jgi:NADH-quinone oxidoreductase subunit M
VLVGTYTRYPVAAVIATVGMVLAAVYILLMYQRMMHGPVKEGNEGFADLSPREVAVMAPVLAIIVVLGFYPRPVLDVITPAVDVTMNSIGERDPAPLVQAAEGAR